MKEGETLKAYSYRYWELYNEIRGNNWGVVANTYKVELPIDFELRVSHTINPMGDMQKLMKMVEDD